MKRLFTLVLFVSIFAALSCSHEDPTYPMKIYVKFETTEAPVPNAIVTIPPVTKQEKPQTLTTNESGVVNYTFDLPAIVQIIAQSADSLKAGEVMVRLKEDETVVKTIYLKDI